MTALRILLVEPFLGGSHRQWAEGYAAHSQHELEIIGLPARHWKWRMHGAAIHFASQLNERKAEFDLLLCTDMLDVATFKALLKPEWRKLPLVTYYHENQFSYPWSERDPDVTELRDYHYGFTNFTSGLASDHCLFNSNTHRNQFLADVERFLKRMPDTPLLRQWESLRAKCSTLHLGMELSAFDAYEPEGISEAKNGLILWNHRWEYDKGPKAFFDAMYSLHERGLRFDLAVLGQSFREKPKIFREAESKLADHIVSWGYSDSFAEYAEWLYKADILPVTSIQDFFGVSVLEAVYCNVKPLLPKREVYFEHIPEVYRSAFFYEDPEDLVNRLQRQLFNIRVLRKQKTRQIAAVYDWSQLVGSYDERFAALAEGVEFA